MYQVDGKNNKFDPYDTDTPFGSTEKNPFRAGNEGKNEDLSPALANAKKCPGCGGNLIYEIDSGHVICRSCGSVYDPRTMEMNGSLGIHTPEQEYGVNDELSPEDQSGKEIVCNSCGCEIVTDANTAATICPFCGSPALITRRLTRMFRPDALIPFSVTRKRAKDLYREHIMSVSHVPKTFKEQSAIENMRGIYVPFWLISADVNMSIGGWERRIIDGSDSYDPVKQETTGRHVISVPIDGTLEFSLKNIPFDGSAKISNRLMQAIEPFDLKDLTPYNASFLSGYLAEKYDSQPKDMYDAIKLRMDNYCHDIAETVSFKDCDHFDYNSSYSSITYSNYTVIYCLMPVWFLNIRHKDLNYRFAINGQTGEVCGTVPETAGGGLLARTAAWMDKLFGGVNRQLRHIFYIAPALVTGILMGSMRGCVDTGEDISPVAAIMAAVLGALTLFMILGVFLGPALLAKERERAESFGKKDPHNLDRMPEASYYLDTGKKIKASKKLVKGAEAGIAMPGYAAPEGNKDRYFDSFQGL